MNVTYSEKVKQSAKELELLRQATARLEEAIGPSANRVNAEWDRTVDEKGQSAYTLRVSDPEDSATASFAPDDFELPRSLQRTLLYLVWDKVLASRLHKQLAKVQAMDDSEN